VNVWLALAHQIHPHHRVAASWGESLDANTILVFCRFTQLGLLRLLTNRSAMGADMLTQAEAWTVYEVFLETRRAQWSEEPEGIDPVFRRLTNRDEASTKQWADGYLAAFSVAARIGLVTFDRALAAGCPKAVLLA
jgi:hypothetical protein